MSKKSNTIVEMYDYYINNYESVYIIDYNIYRDILNNFFKTLSNNLIHEGKNIKLPFSLGYLEINKSKKWFKNKRLSIDFKSTKEFGKTIYYLNEHSDGYKYNCHWSKIGSRIKNINKYRFILSRTNKRDLAKIIFNKERDYIEKW